MPIDLFQGTSRKNPQEMNRWELKVYNRERRLQGLPEIDISQFQRPTPELTPEPLKAFETPPSDMALWQKGLHYFTSPFQYVHEKAILPFAAAVTSPWSPEVEGTEDLPWLERELAEYEKWESPWGVKGLVETLPWFAIPGVGAVGKAGMGARGIAGALGKLAPKLGRAAPLVKGAAKALEYSPYGLMEKVPMAAMKALRPAIPPGVKIIGKVLRIPKTEVLLNAAKVEALPSGHWLLKIPGMRKVLGAIKASWVADDPIKATYVIQGQMQDMARAGVIGSLAKLRAMNPNIKVVAGIVDDPVIKQLKKLPGEKMSMALNDVIEHSPRYSMPANYRKFINEIRVMSKAFSRMAKEEKLKLRQIKGEGDFVYLHRIVVSVKEEQSEITADLLARILATQGSKMTRAKGESPWAFLTRFSDDLATGKMKPTPELDKVMDEIAKLADISDIRGRIDRPRFYTLAADGMKAGVKYADDPLQELKFQADATYDMIIKKRVGELMQPLGILPKTRVPAELAASRAAITGKRLALRQVTQIIQRTQAGADVSGAAWRGIKQFYPTEYAAIKKAIKEGLPLDDFTKFVVSETEALKSTYKVVQPQYIMALTKAKLPKPEEAMLIGVPGISGRIIPTQIIGGKKVFGTEIAREISKKFGWAPPGVAERWMRNVGAFGGAMRMAKASLDLSAQFIQTLPILGIDAHNLMTSPLYFMGIRKLPIFGMVSKPSHYWATGLKEGVKAFINPAKAEAGYWANPVNRFYLMEGAKYGALAEPSELVEYFGPALTKIRKMPRVGGKIARVMQETYGRAEAAFTATRNVTANEYRKGMWGAAKAMGALPQLARSSNLLTGVLSTRGMGISQMQRSVESGLLWFSPRFTRSVGALFGHMIRHPNSWTGREAMNAITGLMTANVLFFSTAAMVMGQKPKLDPRPKSMGGDGAEWMTVKIGDRFIGLGGILSDIRAAVNIVSQAFDDPAELLAFDMSNPAFRRIRAKFAPPTSAFYDYMIGRDFIGNPVRGESLFPTHETALAVGKWALPIWVEGMIEEGASLGGVLGEFFGGRTFPESEWDIYKNRMRELSGKRNVKEISYRERVELENKYPELVELKEAAQDEMRRRGYNVIASEYWDRRDDSLQSRINLLEEAQKQFDAGKISGKDIRRLIQDTGLVLGTEYKLLEGDARYAEVIAEMNERSVERTEEALEKGWAVDLAYQQYWDIMFDPELISPLGEPLYAKRDGRLDLLRRSVGEPVWRELQEWLKESRQKYPFVVRQYYLAQATLKPYWNIENEVWARLPSELKQIADEIAILERTDPRKARILLGHHPRILYARKMIAMKKKQLKRQDPAIAEALKLFY